MILDVGDLRTCLEGMGSSMGVSRPEMLVWVFKIQCIISGTLDRNHGIREWVS